MSNGYLGGQVTVVIAEVTHSDFNLDARPTEDEFVHHAVRAPAALGR
jgi:hypothetical protein